jgi:hypothetical protein
LLCNGIQSKLSFHNLSIQCDGFLSFCSNLILHSFSLSLPTKINSSHGSECDYQTDTSRWIELQIFLSLSRVKLYNIFLPPSVVVCAYTHIISSENKKNCSEEEGERKEGREKSKWLRMSMYKFIHRHCRRVSVRVREWRRKKTNSFIITRARK